MDDRRHAQQSRRLRSARFPTQEWAGLRDAKIQEATGVADAVFVHAARFCGAARSREGALKMAGKALELRTATGSGAGTRLTAITQSYRLHGPIHVPVPDG